MDEIFNIEVWSDVVCPFCYLGSRQLADALARFEHRSATTVRHRAFELDPRAPARVEGSLDELVAAKYQMPVERAHDLHGRLESSAAQLGMTWSLATARPSNTLDAHRVIALGQTQGRGTAVSERLFRAYFCEGALLSDHDTLNALGAEVGVTGVDSLWSGDDFIHDVRSDEREAQELGITGVPTIRLDGRFMIVGAQGSDQMLDTLRRAWARRAA